MDVLDGPEMEAAVAAALAEVAQSHGAVVVDWLAVVNVSAIEGSETADRVLFLDSGDTRITAALGLGSLLEGYLSNMRDHALYVGDDGEES